MKKTNILLMGLTASIVALIVYLVLQSRRRDQRRTAYRQSLATGGNAYTFPEASETFTGLNWYLILEPGVTGYEVVVLQTMLQRYNNEIVANGFFDDVTADTLQELMNKDSTNLYEMRYQYFDQDFSDEEAQQIFDSVTPQS